VSSSAHGIAEGRVRRRARAEWSVVRRAARRFGEIDGSTWADSIAFNAFFALFPLILLAVTVASFFVDRDSAGRAIVSAAESYVPLDASLRARVFEGLAEIIRARQQAGILALIMLLWTSLQLFTTLVRVTNRAWGELAQHSVWSLPARGLVLLVVTGGVGLAGMGAASLASLGASLLVPADAPGVGLVGLWARLVPLLVMFGGLTMIYKLAPHRPTRVADVWVGAAFTTIVLQLGQALFVVYLESFATLNAVYGVLGGVMALLLWIFLSGCGFVFGACMCWARAEDVGAP
jgi:YihY family inner membrane protein